MRTCLEERSPGTASDSQPRPSRLQGQREGAPGSPPSGTGAGQGRAALPPLPPRPRAPPIGSGREERRSHRLAAGPGSRGAGRAAAMRTAVVLLPALAALGAYYVYLPLPGTMSEPWKLMLMDASFRAIQETVRSSPLLPAAGRPPAEEAGQVASGAMKPSLQQPALSREGDAAVRCPSARSLPPGSCSPCQKQGRARARKRHCRYHWAAIALACWIPSENPLCSCSCNLERCWMLSPPPPPPRCLGKLFLM